MNKMNYKGFCTSVAERKWMNYKHISYYIVLKVRNTRYCAGFSFIENIKPLVTKLLKQQHHIIWGILTKKHTYNRIRMFWCN